MNDDPVNLDPDVVVKQEQTAAPAAARAQASGPANGGESNGDSDDEEDEGDARLR